MGQRTLTLEALAKLTGAKLAGDPTHTITGVANLESASPSDAAFLANSRYEKQMRQSAAGVIFIVPTTSQDQGRNYLITEDPSLAFQMAIEAFLADTKTTGFEGIHPSAIIHKTAQIGKNVTVGPNAVIDAEVTIGDSSTIGSGCYIGPQTTLGNSCLLYPNVTIREQSTLGNNVILHPGVVIGSCGYGYTTTKQGTHQKLKQLGTVTLEDDVEIGANTTIDRARFTTTRIRRGTKIDNLCQIAHGVDVGEDNLIIGQSGIAGSAKTGRHVILAGQSAINGHITLDDGVIIAGKSGVSKSLKAGKYSGIPVLPASTYNRNSVYLRSIEQYVKAIKALEKRVAELESLPAKAR